MAYTHTNSKGATYYLHRKVAKLRNGREQPIFYFAKAANLSHAVDALPAGYVVREMSSGLPLLKKQAVS